MFNNFVQLLFCPVLLYIYGLVVCRHLNYFQSIKLPSHLLKWRAQHALWLLVRMTSQSMRLKLDLLSKYVSFSTLLLGLMLYQPRFFSTISVVIIVCTQPYARISYTFPFSYHGFMISVNMICDVCLLLIVILQFTSSGRKKI